MVFSLGSAAGTPVPGTPVRVGFGLGISDRGRLGGEQGDEKSATGKEGKATNKKK